MSFLLFTLCMSVISYPFIGAVVYGDPWTFIFKSTEHDNKTL